MTQFLEADDGVLCLVAAQPVTARTIIERRLAGLGLPELILTGMTGPLRRSDRGPSA